MSSSEAPNSVTVNKLESDPEYYNFRPQRPPPSPPPPPPHQFEPHTPPIEITVPSTEPIVIAENIPLVPEASDESNNHVDNGRPSLLRFEFTALFDNFDYESVRDQILNRQMLTSPFTSVLWRIFLHCLPRDSSQWNQVIDSSRDTYDELVNKYYLDLQRIRAHHEKEKDRSHPLSQEEDSLWHQYYVYEELKENIYQDVIRTCQELSFFRQKDVLDLLLKNLYIHSRRYEQSLPYRQGMHEILAVIVFLMHMESVRVNEYPESNELMRKLYDPKYLAHDSYAIYEKILNHLQQFYDFQTNTVTSRKNPQMNGSKQVPFKRTYDIQIQTNDTVLRVNSIFERLKEYDPSLYEKLTNLNIEPTVYGIRWLRLLFGREIPFGYIPSLWTVIFCYDECFGFVDYFFLALLMEVGLLFESRGISEYSLCLQYLMQPNDISDVEETIQKALRLEKNARRKDSHRSPYSSSLPFDMQRQSSLTQGYSQNLLIEPIRSNSTASSSRATSSNISKDAEMTVDPGKETRERFDGIIQLQRNCADFMNKFINRIRGGVQALHAPNEEIVLLQLNGLEQIAHVLKGALPFDEEELQALLNYQCKERLITMNANSTN